MNLTYAEKKEPGWSLRPKKLRKQPKNDLKEDQGRVFIDFVNRNIQLNIDRKLYSCGILIDNFKEGI